MMNELGLAHSAIRLSVFQNGLNSLDETIGSWGAAEVTGAQVFLINERHNGALTNFLSETGYKFLKIGFLIFKDESLDQGNKSP